MVSWHDCQPGYARNISGEFLWSIYAQLKLILHVTEWLSHKSFASECCKFPIASDMQLLYIIVLRNYALWRVNPMFLEMTIEIWDKELSQLGHS